MHDWFEGGRSFNFWSFVIGVIGLVLGLYGLYVTFRFKREKRPLYLTSSYEVISTSHSVDGLQITLQGVVVSSLTVTRMSFWNAGRETMHRSDIAASDPIRIVALRPGITILGAKLAHVCRPVNDVSISATADAVAIEFDFLDRGDGCVVDLYHSSPSGFSVIGTLKGAPPPTDARRAKRYKVDLAADWFFDRIATPLTEGMPAPIAFLLTFPLYLPFRLLSMPFGLLEMFFRPFRAESAEPPKGLQLK